MTDYLKGIPSSVNKGSSSGGCSHPEIIKEGNVEICIECGEEVDTNNNFEQDWRFYGNNDNVNSKDPARCQYRKTNYKNISDDLKNMNFPSDIVIEANNLFMKVTDHQIRRSKTRKAIIFACVFHAFKNSGHPRSFESLQSNFNLSKKVISQGLNQYGMKINDYSPCITPNDLVPEIIQKLGGEIVNTEEVNKIFNTIKNRSDLINRSKPQSIASGLIYYYCTLTKRSLSIDDISGAVGLSIATIKKIAEEIDLILETGLYKKRKRVKK